MYKNKQMQKLEDACKNDPELAKSKDQDLTGKINDEMITLTFVMKFIKHLVFLTSVSYFLAMTFKIIIDIQNYNNDWNDLDYESVDDLEHRGFIHFYGIQDKSMYEISLILLYFSFTSLTTDGLGDFTPRSNAERAYISMALLFGVMLFSYVMGEFVEIFQS